MADAAELILLLRKLGHDMRVPLSTLISTSDMLVEGAYDPLSPKQNKAALRLQRSSHRLLAMLDDFIIYVKADAGDLVPQVRPFDLRMRLAEWVKPVQEFLDEKNVNLIRKTAETVPSTLTSDEALIQRVVVALVWNSAAYTNGGSVTVATEMLPENRWQLTVQDTGSGITDADRPHIFEPFWRGELRPQVPTAGAGLGLPMCLAVAKLMGGSLILKETSPAGSTFCLELPLELLTSAEKPPAES